MDFHRSRGMFWIGWSILVRMVRNRGSLSLRVTGRGAVGSHCVVRGGFGEAAIASTLPCTGKPIRVNRLTNMCMPTSVCIHCLQLGGRSMLFVNNSSRRKIPVAVHTGGRKVAPRSIMSHCRALVGGSFRRFNVSFSICDHAASPARRRLTSSFFGALCGGNRFVRGASRRCCSRRTGAFLTSHCVANRYPRYRSRNTCNSRYRGYNASLSPASLVGPGDTVDNDGPIVGRAGR